MSTNGPPQERTLTVRCSSWDRARVFYVKKLRDGDTLSVQVPFAVRIEDTVRVVMQLPGNETLEFSGVVGQVGRPRDGRNIPIVLLVDDIALLRQRFAKLVSQAAQKSSISADQAATSADQAATQSASVVVDTAPLPAPTDVPIDEIVADSGVYDISRLSHTERQVYAVLDGKHLEMKEMAAHELLGIEWNADVDAVRSAYFALAKRFHPDVFAKYRAEAIRLRAQEVFILVNRAYDRMRDVLVSEGRAVLVGPALMSHEGWLLGIEQFDDYADVEISGVDTSATPSVPIEEQLHGQRAETAAAPTVSVGQGANTSLDATVLFDDIEERQHDPADAAGGANLESRQYLAADGQPVMNPAAGEDTHTQTLARERIDGLLHQGRQHLLAGEYDRARCDFAALLQSQPRNREARALYRTACGRLLMSKGELVAATTQLETALTHDPDCAEARSALAEMKRSRGTTLNGGILRRIFR